MFEKIKEWLRAYSRSKTYACETCEHQYYRHEFSDGKVMYSCRKKKAKMNDLRLIQDVPKVNGCKNYEKKARSGHGKQHD